MNATGSNDVKRLTGLTGTAAVLLMALAASGDERGLAANPHTGGLHFARLQYQDIGSWRGRRGRWLVDYPEADEHFTLGVGRLTRIEMGVPVILQLTDESLFDYPFLYAVEVGYWYLDEVEAARPREYLLEDFSWSMTFTARASRIRPAGRDAANSATPSMPSAQSRKFAYDTRASSAGLSRRVSFTIISRPDSGNGRASKKTLLTAVNTIVLAPMPTPRHSTARATKPGHDESERMA
jgi:hypothetical protein